MSSLKRPPAHLPQDDNDTDDDDHAIDPELRLRRPHSPLRHRGVHCRTTQMRGMRRRVEHYREL
ncbi:hypothetical protein B0H16DRAFT_1711479 [Mycena metata]|uniref:Uncharacterized protein n=1 Tax=Mycena metata TaxID=1033252 RepID=A0AAD7K888_9AGAR|nr:hypothetical protein B0H16DRAFT_1711479 [Mycena metata]